VEPEVRAKIERIDRNECLELLQTKSKVGRVAFVVNDRPIVLPVNYRADRDSVVFCTASGSMLTNLKDGAPAAFEVDSSVSLLRSGWSVLVQGTASEVTDPEELEKLRRGPLKSWATPSTEHWIKISIDQISGRRIPEA
jgi:nitroimidazol reductase NimA-like FMN-containing flavoprotein (pyridoxamine 5'-phosphate oxidase superfamily)